MAIDGRSGQELWRRYTPHELYASNCNNDLNDDGIKDCILAGRMAVRLLKVRFLIKSSLNFDYSLVSLRYRWFDWRYYLVSHYNFWRSSCRDFEFLHSSIHSKRY